MLRINKIFVILLVSFLFLFSCVKERNLKEGEDIKIMNYIQSTGLKFDTSNSGAIYHLTYLGSGQKYGSGSVVPLVYSGFYFNSSNTKVDFKKDDTIFLNLNSTQILDGWREVLQNVSEGASGTIIFPYKVAFKKKKVPNIPSNATLFFDFDVVTTDYKIKQSSLFWKYTERYDSILTKYQEDVCYAKFFDGFGAIPSTNSTYIDYEMYDINDKIYISSQRFQVLEGDANLPAGFFIGLNKMKEGEMGKIIIPPSQAFLSENVFDIEPFSALVFQVRVIAASPSDEEKSKINKFLYVSNIKADTIFPNKIMLFYNKKNKEENAKKIILNSNISYSDSLFLINNSLSVEKCEDCSKILNSDNFHESKIKCLLQLKEGEEATFIIPYSEAYGSIGNDKIPPYSTLLYRVNVKSIID